MRILQIILIIPLISQNDQNVFRQDFCDLHEAFQFFRKRFLSDNFIPATYSAPRFFSINKGLGRCSLQLEDIEHEKVNKQKTQQIYNVYTFSKTNIFFFCGSYFSVFWLDGQLGVDSSRRTWEHAATCWSFKALEEQSIWTEVLWFDRITTKIYVLSR